MESNRDRLIRTDRALVRVLGALREADEELLRIADDVPEDIGERIDSVRALLKDAAASDGATSLSAAPSAPIDAATDSRKRKD